MQQHVTVRVSGKRVAISPELHRTQKKNQTSHFVERDMRVMQRVQHAHSVRRSLLFDFIDCNINSHNSQDELIL